MERLKPMIKPFDSGWSYILDLSLKLISLLVIWSYNCNNAEKKKVTHLGTSIARVCQTALNVIPQWTSKPRIRKPNKYRKASSGAGRFAQNLRTCKKSHYNIQNCKSGRHNQRHSFKRHRSQHRPISTNIPYDGLTVKGRNTGITKPPSPRRQNCMPCTINHQQHITNHTIIQVDSNTNLLDKMILTEVVTRPTRKLRSVGPHKSISKKIDNKKKEHLENKKFRSVNKSLYGIHVYPDDDDDNVPQQRLLFTNKNKTNYSSINNDTYIPIITWKLTKNRSHIISDISIPGCLPHSGSIQRFVLNADSPNMSEKDIDLLTSSH